jgi:16S rRNA processing protein RimM
MTIDTKNICVGAIMGSFGVQGEVRLKSFCARPEDVGSFGPVMSEDGTATYDLKVTRPVKSGFAARIKGVTNKDAADNLRGVRLYVSRDALPNLPDDEFYYSDLVGMTVLDTGGEVLGKVRAVHDHGAGDILEIRMPEGGDAMLPFTKAAVPTIDLASRRIVVDPPDGVFSD